MLSKGLLEIQECRWRSPAGLKFYMADGWLDLETAAIERSLGRENRKVIF